MIAFFFSLSPFHTIDEYNGHDPQRCYLDDVIVESLSLANAGGVVAAAVVELTKGYT